MIRDLVIGYGNTLRGDDGVGPRVAEAVESWGRDSVRAIACRQLTPELAGDVAAARRVIFVDATIDPGASIGFDPIEAEDSGQVLIHASHPKLLLGLARRIYGGCPPAWWLTIPVADFGFRDSLSPSALRKVGEATACIERVFGNAASSPPPSRGHNPGARSF